MINVHKYLFEYILAVMFPVKCHAADKWLAYSTGWQLMTPSNCLEGLGLRLLSWPHLWPQARIRGWMTLTKILVPICFYCLKCTKFGQLILRKII